jgi:hypothetical protein
MWFMAHRWPDLLVAYYAPSRILFSSKLFSAHVSPPEVRVLVVCVAGGGGWGGRTCLLSKVAAPSYAPMLWGRHYLSRRKVLHSGDCDAVMTVDFCSIQVLLPPLMRRVTCLMRVGGRCIRRTGATSSTACLPLWHARCVGSGSRCLHARLPC